MLAFLRQLANKYDNWVGDREMEMSIRRHLTDHGYFGSTAQFRAVRLVAVERPGWVQVYRFEVRARINPGDDDQDKGQSGPDEAVYHDLFGLVQDDARHKVSNVRVFDDESARRELFQLWGDGLIRLRGAKGL